MVTQDEENRNKVPHGGQYKKAMLHLTVPDSTLDPESYIADAVEPFMHDDVDDVKRQISRALNLATKENGYVKVEKDVQDTIVQGVINSYIDRRSNVTRDRLPEHPMDVATSVFAPIGITYRRKGFVIAKGYNRNNTKLVYAARWHIPFALGHPSGFGKPQWFELPDDFTYEISEVGEPLLKMKSPHESVEVGTFIDLNTTGDRTYEGYVVSLDDDDITIVTSNDLLFKVHKDSTYRHADISADGRYSIFSDLIRAGEIGLFYDTTKFNYYLLYKGKVFGNEVYDGYNKVKLERGFADFWHIDLKSNGGEGYLPLPIPVVFDRQLHGGLLLGTLPAPVFAVSDDHINGHCNILTGMFNKTLTSTLGGNNSLTFTNGLCEITTSYLRLHKSTNPAELDKMQRAMYPLWCWFSSHGYLPMSINTGKVLGNNDSWITQVWPFLNNEKYIWVHKS